jgi:hypothetical protein
MIVSDTTAYYFDLVLLADFSHKVFGSMAYIAYHNWITVFGYPYDVIGAIVGTVATFTIIMHSIAISAEATGWKPGVFLPNLGQ